MRTRDAATAIFYGQQARDCACGCDGKDLSETVVKAARDAATKVIRDAFSPQAREAALRARRLHAKAAEAHTAAANHYEKGGLVTTPTGAANHASQAANASEHNVKAAGADKQAHHAMMTGDRKKAAKFHSEAAAAHKEHAETPVKALSGQYKAPKVTRGLLG